jgi:phage gpG-like protein
MALTNDLLRMIGVLVTRQVGARIRTGNVTPKTSKHGRTLVERGHLLRSIKYRIEGDAVVISAGAQNVPYARIHHEGGVIKPKNAKYLAIPLTPQAKLYKPRQYPGETFIAKGIIFLKQDGQKPLPLYALKKQVELPERRYMFVSSVDREQIKKAVVGWLKQQFAGKGEINA